MPQTPANDSGAVPGQETPNEARAARGLSPVDGGNWVAMPNVRRAAPQTHREQRRLTLDDVEVRVDKAGGGDEIRVKGHAAVWDKPAWIGPPKYGFSERFNHGAFKESINGGADVRYLFNHNPDAVLARTKSGTLTLREDGSGLSVDARLAPTSVGRDLAILMDRGDVNQMSVGMQVLEDRWEEISGADGNMYEQRTIIRAKLFDVSAVTYPAYEETDAGLRDADHARELRDARGVHVTRRNADGSTPPPAVLPNVTITSDDSGRTVSASSTNGEAPRTWTFDTTAAPNAPSPTPPAGGETPEGPVPTGTGVQLPGPATATSIKQDVRTLADSERPVHELLTEHAFTNEHRLTPRLMCPACTRPATATTV